MTSFCATLLAGSGSGTFMLLFGAAAGLYCFVRGFLLLQRKRLVQNTPISKIRSASLGLVEVTGLAAGPHTLPAPITGVACFCYRTVAWQEKGSDKDRSWEIVAEEKLHVPFFLDDNTGKLLVDPTGAELDLHQDFHQEFSDSIFSADSPAPQTVRNFLMRYGVDGGRKTRIDEYCIKPKNFLFILGTLAENPGLAVVPRAAPFEKGRAGAAPARYGLTAELTISSLAQPASTARWADVGPLPESVVDLTATLPAPSTSGEMTQQAKISAALLRAGIATPDIRTIIATDPPKGGTYGGTSARLPSPIALPGGSNGQPAMAGKSPVAEFDLQPPVVLMRGRNKADYLISWRDQRKLVSSMHWKSALMIWGGPALTLFSLYLLAAQLGWL